MHGAAQAPFARRVVIAGVLLGGTTGALIGLSESPVAGVAVTATLTLAGSLMGGAARSTRALITRWRIFALFVVPFVLGLLPAMTGGLIWRSSRPSPSEQMIATLTRLGLNNTQIADQLGKAAATNGGAAALFPVDSILRSASEPAGSTPITSCSDEGLAPPANRRLFADPQMLGRFMNAGGRFRQIAEWVQREDVSGGQADTYRLALLSAARIGACGS